MINLVIRFIVLRALLMVPIVSLVLTAVFAMDGGGGGGSTGGDPYGGAYSVSASPYSNPWGAAKATQTGKKASKHSRVARPRR